MLGRVFFWVAEARRPLASEPLRKSPELPACLAVLGRKGKSAVSTGVQSRIMQIKGSAGPLHHPPRHVSCAREEEATKVCNRAHVTRGFPWLSWTSVARI